MFLRPLFSFLLLTLPALAAPKVIVSLAPTKYLVERIAGDKVIVEKFVPSGASPHSYEPTPRQLLDAASGVLWFRIGEGFEGRTLDVIKDKTKIVNLRDGLPLLSGPSCKCHPNDIYDPHIWLSIPLLKIQAQTITNALSGILPDSKPLFEANLAKLQEDLSTLDFELQGVMLKCPRKFILVTHPAFGYFCRDYGLTQLSIEVDGKEPTARQMTDLIQIARAQNIDRLILEPQHNTKGGFRVAAELNIPVIWLDPYQENVMENLKAIAKAITE